MRTLNVDWVQVFRPDTPILEIIFRGSVIYLALFAFLRLGIKREAGTLGISDLLVIVLLADAAQNAMAGEYTSITDGLVLVATLVFWSYALDWLGYRYPRLGQIIDPPPLVIITDGHLHAAKLRKQLITQEQIMSYLRERGIEDLSQVYRAYLASDGRISVVTFMDRAKSQAFRRGGGVG
ncbi:MAG TPA: YetF domain-containing protein [Gemmatimonadaceae bacterium]|jgi:Predicted membrane protein